MFLSLHSNACGTESVDYPVVYRAYDGLNGADVLAGKLAEVDAQLAGVHAKLQSAAQMESTELNSAIAQTREETEQCARALAERLRHSRAHQVGEIADAFEEIRVIVRRVQTEVRRGDESGEEMQLLFAEYAMDFAMQAARHALLVALEAIRDEQRKGSAAE